MAPQRFPANQTTPGAHIAGRASGESTQARLLLAHYAIIINAGEEMR